MEECFHKQCDVPSSLPDLEGSFLFLSRITQALVLAIYDLTMPSASSSQECLYRDSLVSTAPRLTVVSATEAQDNIKKETKPEAKEKVNTESNEKSQTKSHPLSGSGSNYIGTQINIENLYVNSINNFVDNAADHSGDREQTNALEEMKKDKDFFLYLTSKNTNNPLAKIMKNYYHPPSTDAESKHVLENSPMMIKLLKNTEL